MRRLLVAFEDQNYQPLITAVWRLCLDIAPELRAHRHQLHTDTVRGDGGFQPYLLNDWPILAAHGFKRSGPINELLCVVDLDNVTRSLGVEREPAAPADTDAWTANAQRVFEDRLGEWNKADSTQVRGAVLRWNSESLLLAASFDRILEPDVLSTVAAGAVSDRDLEKFFATSCTCAGKACDPREIDDSQFVHHWRKPGECLDRLLAQLGVGPLAKAKADTRRTALVNACTQDEAHRRKLEARMPELHTIAQTIVDVMTG